MFLIAYTSEYTGEITNLQSDVESIVQTSRNRNREVGITGVMFLHESRFLQFLEGEELQLRSLLLRIENDPRHSNLQYLLESPVERREFPSWNMDCFQLPEGESLELEYLIQIRDAYRANFSVRSKTFVEMFRSFIED